VFSKNNFEVAMSTQTQPTNINYLSPLGFKFTINKLPNLEYFVQSIDVPRLSLNATNDVQTPFNKIIIPGDHLSFENFTVTFKIDEDMTSYIELYNWIISVGFPDSFDQYKSIASNSLTSGKGVLVDADLVILNSAMRPNIKITFIDVLPVSISGFEFDSTIEDVRYLTATATFKYREYTINKL